MMQRALGEGASTLPADDASSSRAWSGKSLPRTWCGWVTGFPKSLRARRALAHRRM